MSDQDRIICSCANLTEEQIKSFFKKNNNKYPSFEEFLTESKAGTYCTACRLDLETIFIKENIVDANFQTNMITKNLTLKKNFYNFIDSIFPKLTLKNQNYFPVLNIRDINFEQSIWITNMEIISEKIKNKIKIDDVEVTLNLFNSLGKKVWSNKEIIKVNDRGIFKIPSDKITTDDKKFSVGWIEVIRKFKLNCSKGTTRPQIMVFSENSNCAVHGQDIGFTSGSSHSSIFRPDTDLQILSFINPNKNSVKLKLDPPKFISEKVDNKNLKSINIKIPPHGSKFHIINDDERFKHFNNKYFTINWNGYGKYKSHIYCLSKNFRFVSLDHL